MEKGREGGVKREERGEVQREGARKVDKEGGREVERWTGREGGGEMDKEGGREGGGVRSRTSKDKLKPERKERHRDIGGHETAVEVTDGHDIVTHR